MATYSQIVRGCRIKKAPSTRTFKLRKNPQIVTIVWRIFYASPKKPNSGKRRVAKARVRHVKRRDRLTARLTSYAYFPRKYARLLVRGGRANDTPGVTYSGIRGAYDFRGHLERKKSRSFYGLKRPTANVARINRSVRKSGINTVEEYLRTRGRAF